MENRSSASVTMVIGGDTCLGESYLERGHSRTLRRLHSRPWTFYERLLPLVTDNDHFIVNLETVLTDDPPPPLHPDKLYCRPDTIEPTIRFLKELGVSAVSLGNNHAMDFGPEGLRSTTDALASAGIRFFGAGDDSQAAARPLPLDGIYVLAGYRSNPRFARFGIYAADDKPGVHGFSRRFSEDMVDWFEGIRKQDNGAFIIAFPHWGANYAPPTPSTRASNVALLRAGANLVLGCGAHNLQTCLTRNGRTSVFSLGNFVFNSPGRYSKLGAAPFSVVARLTLTKRNRDWEPSLRLYPIISDNRLTRFRPRPVDEMEALRVFSYLASQEPRFFETHHCLRKDERGWFIGQR